MTKDRIHRLLRHCHLFLLRPRDPVPPCPQPHRPSSTKGQRHTQITSHQMWRMRLVLSSHSGSSVSRHLTVQELFHSQSLVRPPNKPECRLVPLRKEEAVLAAQTGMFLKVLVKSFLHVQRWFIYHPLHELQKRVENQLKHAERKCKNKDVGICESRNSV